MPKNQTEGSHHHDKEMDRKILDFIAEHPGTDRVTIANSLTNNYSSASINEHIRKLKADGDLLDGLFLTDAGKKKQMKVYILIYTQRRPISSHRIPGENYQQRLVDDIRNTLMSKEFNKSIYLDAIDIVMGGDFDVVLTIRANVLEPIGNLVTGFLRSHKYIFRTKTILAWPSSGSHPQLNDESESPAKPVVEEG